MTCVQEACRGDHRVRQLLLRIALCACLLLPGWAHAGDERDGEGFDRFIVLFELGSAAREDASLRQRVLDLAATGLGARAHPLFRLWRGADVIKVDRRLGAAQARVFMDRLALDPGVAYVEPDRVVKPAALTFDDVLYKQGYQWNLTSRYAGINALPAWEMAYAQPRKIAVLDSGIIPHPDFLYFGGYDFVSDLAMANDGNGRDASPLDPGDWAAADACGAGSPATDSSWHGTLVAGIAAAYGNNGAGIIGLAYDATIQPVRVIGRCGGYVSDLADAIAWTGGATVPGIPVNPHLPSVINLSLDSAGTCGTTLQAAIDLAVGKGIAVVAAAGNSGEDASGHQPANCNNVIAVGATSRRGDLTAYSNFGAAVDVLAPGGDSGGLIPSTWNNSTTSYVLKPIYALAAGTSMAAPQVAGVVALMQTAKPGITPAEIEAALKSTARPPMLPCQVPCGAGIVNAAAAVGAATGGRLTIDDTTMREGNADFTAMRFTVRLSRPMPNPVTFDIAANAYLLDAGDDFEWVSLVGQVIPAGQTSYDFWVPIRGDTDPEFNETLRVVVSNVTGIGVADDTALGLIINDDPYTILPDRASPNFHHNLSPPDDILEAGEYGLVKFEVPVGTTDLTVSSTDNSPSGGKEASNDGDLYVRFGEQPTLTEADCIQQHVGMAETCHFSNPPAGTWYAMLYGYSRIFGNVRFHAEPEIAPRLTVWNKSIDEGNNGSHEMLFEVNLLSTIPQTDVYVDVSTSPGTAMPGVDYEPLYLPHYKIPAGTSTSSPLIFAVKVYGDTEVEGHETFQFNLSNPVGVIIERPQALGRITNDDKATLKVLDAQVIEGEGGPHTLTMVAELSHPMPNPTYFSIYSYGGTATPGVDFVAPNLSNVFMDAGRTRKTFEITVIGDTLAEGDETFYVTTGAPSGAGLVTIVDDDVAAAPARKASRSLRVPPAAAPAAEPVRRACRPPRARVTPATRKLAVCRLPLAP